MEVGPPEPAFRSRLQTTPSGWGKEPAVVSIGVKRGANPMQVWIRKTTAREPSMTRRKASTVVKTRAEMGALGLVCRTPDYWADDDRRKGGVTLILASARNCGNQSLRWQGKSPSGQNHEAKLPMRS